MPIILPSRYQNAPTRPADVTQQMADLYDVVTQINNGNSPTTLANLDIVSTVASTPVPTTPTIFAPLTTMSSSNITYDSATGIVTFNFTGTYQTTFLLNVFPTALTTLFFGAEIDFNNGLGFQAILNSGRQISCNVNINGQIMFTSYNRFPAGTRARVYVWANVGTATFQTTSLAALPLGAVQVPALRQIITGQSA